MPLRPIQVRVLQIIAAHRTPESHVAGGVALNRDGPRLSFDIDIFNDSVSAVAAAAEIDTEALRAAGFEVEWKRRFENFHSAVVSQGGEVTEIDWAHDSAFRFFPAEPDPVLGYALHPFDLATNKALAAASRSVPRDAVDVVTIHERLYPLGAVAAAAVGKDEGFSPELLLNFIGRFGRWRDEDYAGLPFAEPVDAGDISRRLKSALMDAHAFVERLPSEACGVVFLEDGRIVQPDPDRLDRYERRGGSPGGVWPTLPDALTG